MDTPKYISDMMQGFASKDPRYVDLGNHMGKSEEKILQTIPFETLGQLNQIRFLSIKNNNIKDLSPKIGALTALDFLDVSENPISEIPAAIGQCSSLKNFKATETAKVDMEAYMEMIMDNKPGYHPDFLNEVGLQALPIEFGKLQQLQGMQLEQNRFEEIPDAIFELKALTSLDISFNLLTHVSPKIGQLKDLTYLKLSRNNFHELPDEIGELKKLQRLRLDNLDLYRLPEGIGGLEKLEMMEICYGRRGELPNSIQHLRKFKHFYLIGTEISEIDLNMIKILLPDCEIHFEIS